MMKLILSLSFLILFSPVFAQTESQTVNALIGDQSFQEVFGKLPEAGTDENLRIQTHLLFVEKMLREKSSVHLSSQQLQNRIAVLDLLNQYWKLGIFPSNYDYPGERRPCFIDRDGKICAVGYLIEQTAGLELARQINKDHQYDFLLDMKEKAIENWAETNGLTLEECAMIQPSYGSYPPQVTEVPLKKEYGITSSLLGGVNLSMNFINLAHRNRTGTNSLAYAGIVTGSAQLILGITNIRKDVEENNLMGYRRITTQKARNNLSYINIAAGTTTIFTSAINLYLNSKVKDKRNAFNLYSAPGMGQDLGFSFSRGL